MRQSHYQRQQVGKLRKIDRTETLPKAVHSMGSVILNEQKLLDGAESTKALAIAESGHRPFVWRYT